MTLCHIYLIYYDVNLRCKRFTEIWSKIDLQELAWGYCFFSLLAICAVQLCYLLIDPRSSHCFSIWYVVLHLSLQIYLFHFIPKMSTTKLSIFHILINGNVILDMSCCDWMVLNFKLYLNFTTSSIIEKYIVNPLGPRMTKVVNVSRVTHSLATLPTLFSPPRTSPKLCHFQSAFLRIDS